MGYFYRVSYYLGEKRWEETLRDINQAIRLSPLFGPSYAIRGEVYLQNRRWQSALNDYRKILLLKRDDKNARETYDKIIQQINKAGPGSLLSP